MLTTIDGPERNADRQRIDRTVDQAGDTESIARFAAAIQSFWRNQSPIKWLEKARKMASFRLHRT